MYREFESFVIYFTLHSLSIRGACGSARSWNSLWQTELGSPKCWKKSVSNKKWSLKSVWPRFFLLFTYCQIFFASGLKLWLKVSWGTGIAPHMHTWNRHVPDYWFSAVEGKKPQMPIVGTLSFGVLIETDTPQHLAKETKGTVNMLPPPCPHPSSTRKQLLHTTPLLSVSSLELWDWKACGHRLMTQVFCMGHCC